jgi:hypothetical protein
LMDARIHLPSSERAISSTPGTSPIPL